MEETTLFRELYAESKLHEGWLISQIFSIITSTYIQSKDPLTPQFKEKEIDKIIVQTHKLILLIKNSLDAFFAQISIVEKNLSYTNLIQREKSQEEIFINNLPIEIFYEKKEFDVGVNTIKMQNFHFLANLKKDIPPETNSEITAESRWNELTSEQRLAWQVKNASELSLVDILNTYVELLKEIPEQYKSEYIKSPRATVIRKLYEMTYKNYGSYLSDCVTCLANSILDLQLGIEDITPYKPKEKKS